MTGVDEVPRFNARFKAAAHERYAEMRATGPIHKLQILKGVDSWVVVDYELAREALTHPALIKDAGPAEDVLDAAGFTGHRSVTGMGIHMLSVDPPDHTRLRRLVSTAFTRSRMQALRPRISAIAEQLADAMAPLGQADLVQSFTGPLPIQVISELLGVPEEGRDTFRNWTTQALTSTGHRQSQSFAGLNRYLVELIANKRRSPGEDLLSALVAVHDREDGRLSEAELIGTANLLVIAGHDTTVNLLGNAVVALLAHPDQAHRLRQDPGLLPGAVEEFLRFDPPVEHTTMRFADRDLTLGGTRLPRGAIVVVSLTSAGRCDPALSEAERSTLDVERPNPRHLAFGHGIHYCLGAPLARIEAEIGLGTLLHRFPDLAAAMPLTEITWLPAGIMRGPVTLPVRFSPTN
jgi:cytochrome P450